MGENLERIFAEGTMVYPRFSTTNESIEEYHFKLQMKPSNGIFCVDGFCMSVIAGFGCNCFPRPGWPMTGGDRMPIGYEGPYVAVEVGFPTERPEPWEQWEQFCENPDNPTGTIYCFVPVALVRELVELHGGEIERREKVDQGADNAD